MQRGKIREISWVKPAAKEPAVGLGLLAADAGIADPIRRALRTEGVPVVLHALSFREEALVLLQAAAEIEHALLVQYLYAAYSLQTKGPFRGQALPDDPGKLAQRWQGDIIQIAKEEMGHLITVQNLLRFIRGGRPHLERENYPVRTDLYPFPFELEPLTKQSLAKYVTTEMPVLDHPSWELLEIIETATGAATVPINHVGLLYARLYFLFQEDDTPVEPWKLDASDFPPGHLGEDDFNAADKIKPFQAVPEEWTLDLKGDKRIYVDPILSREDAMKAINKIALEGEGLKDADKSHYQTFLRTYREFTCNAGPTKWIPTWDIATNPNTTGPDRITSRATFLVARLLDVRYQLLLADIWHAVQLDRDHPPTPPVADRATVAGTWAVETEMSAVRRLALQLTQLKQHDTPKDAAPFAGAPFELPFEPFLPGPEPERWGLIRRLLDTSRGLFRQIKAVPGMPKEVLDIVGSLETADAEVRKKLPPEPA
jgi:hypothetical protein